MSLTYYFLTAIFCLVNLIDVGDTSVRNCQLPTCLRMDNKPPNGLNPSEIPQLVFLTFDDSVDSYKDGLYRQIFQDRRNPNGCPIRLTFFTSHEFTDYQLLNQYYNLGHEIASHTITHMNNLTYWTGGSVDDWIKEIDGFRDIASTFANIPKNQIQGFRAPYLQTGGDQTYRALQSLQFAYDSSLPTIQYLEPPIWPYTLDYGDEQDCVIAPCPILTYPGLWNFPLVSFRSPLNDLCAMPDFCGSYRPPDEEKAYDFFQTNFERHYNQSRSPFPIYIHTYWFEEGNYVFTAYLKFIDYLLTLKDVYIVTISQGINYLKNPLTLAQLENSDIFGCPQVEPAPCQPHTCHYPDTGNSPGGYYVMNSCTECPPNYPWLGNPFGK